MHAVASTSISSNASGSPVKESERIDALSISKNKKTPRENNIHTEIFTLISTTKLCQLFNVI